MGEGQNFLEYYFLHKDKDGFVDIGKLFEDFKVYRQGERGIKYFYDKNGKVFIKEFAGTRGLDGEVLLSRIYEKMGFETAKYYPCRHASREELYALSPTIEDENSVLAACFRGRMFKHNGMVFPSVKDMDEPTGYFTPKAIGDVMKLRLTDTATYNHDRHQLNFYYTTENQDNKTVVTGIKTFDYADSGHRALWKNIEVKYFNNFVIGGSTNFLESMPRGRMIDCYKQNETAQAFLPSQEMSAWLGSINFNDEARAVKEETGYQVSEELVDRWAKSFDQMAEELSF